MERGMQIKKVMVLSILLGSSFVVNSAELVYKFVNPNFGGSAFNGGPLLSNATAQNTYKEPTDSNSRNSVESFRERLDRSILSRLSRVLVENAFDEEGKFIEGTIETGLNSINVEEIESGSLVTITNNETGQTTVIEVPSF
jgi:curli production assembly/transport component CsgF